MKEQITTTDKENLTLRELATQLCKQIDIGTAILPKPLFVHDDDETNIKIDNATVECVSNDKDIRVEVQKDKNDETQYAQLVQSEFNAIVIEVRIMIMITFVFLCISYVWYG